MHPASRRQIVQMLETFSVAPEVSAFDLGCLNHETGRMSFRKTWTAPEVRKAFGWLAARNATGSSCYIRPAEALGRTSWVLAGPLAGAGLSAGSGIPTYRGAGGLWTQHGTPPLLSYQEFASDPAAWWQRRLAAEVDPSHPVYQMKQAVDRAAPNAGHMALAELERRGILRCVITQNVDNLQTVAGSSAVLEIHGNRNRLRGASSSKNLPVTVRSTSPIHHSKERRKMTQRAMSRRDFMHVATATSVGALIAACAPAAAPTAGDDGGGAPAMEEVTIEFWVNQPMARSEGLWDTLMAEYEEINPGVTVSSLIIPHRDYEPKVLTGLAGGTVGDLLDVHPMHNATMAMRGALMPLDELMPTLGVGDDEMTKAWDYNVWRGKRWAIPRSDNPTIMLYNRSMVGEAGMDDPAELWAEGKWDIEAFDNTMDAVSGGEGEDRVYGCALPGGGPIRMQCVWIWGNDATVWNAYATASAFNSP